MSNTNFDYLFSKAKSLFNSNDLINALQLAEEAYKIVPESKKMELFEFFGGLYNNLQDKDKAIEFYKKALEKAIRDESKMSILNKIALLYAGKKDIPKSIEYYEACLKIAENINDLEKMMIILKNLGKLYTKNKQYINGLRCHERSLALKRLAGDKLGEAQNLRYIGQDYEASGNYEIARDYYLKSLEIYESIGNQEGIKKLSELLDNLDELESEMEEEDLIDTWNAKYDEYDFF